LFTENKGFNSGGFQLLFAHCNYGMQFAFNWAGVASKG